MKKVTKIVRLKIQQQHVLKIKDSRYFKGQKLKNKANMTSSRQIDASLMYLPVWKNWSSKLWRCQLWFDWKTCASVTEPYTSSLHTETKRTLVDRAQKMYILRAMSQCKDGMRFSFGQVFLQKKKTIPIPNRTPCKHLIVSVFHDENILTCSMHQWTG